MENMFFISDFGSHAEYFYKCICECGKSWTIRGPKRPYQISCPNCGTTSCRSIYGGKSVCEDSKTEMIDDKTFLARRKIFTVFVSRENKTISLESKEYRSITYSLISRTWSGTINGIAVPVNTTNLKKLLSGMNVPDSTFFKEVAGVLGTYSLPKIISAIQQYHIDACWDAYQRISPYFVLRNKAYLLNSTQSKPHKIFKLPKNVFKCLVFGSGRGGREFIRSELQLIQQTATEVSPQVLENLLVACMDIGSDGAVSAFKFLLSHPNFNTRDLVRYLVNDVEMYQGISSPKEALILLKDYVSMCEQMNAPYQKYPKSLKLVHDVTSRNFKLVLDEIKNQQFAEVLKAPEYVQLEYQKDDKYVVLLPKDGEDVIREGKLQSHCVGSYIPDIIRGDHRILFMRKKSDPTQPVITLDVTSENKLYQYKGYGNRYPNEEEMSFIQRWAQEKRLAVC